jgi:hypothetical protein
VGAFVQLEAVALDRPRSATRLMGVQDSDTSARVGGESASGEAGHSGTDDDNVMDLVHGLLQSLAALTRDTDGS